MSTLAETPAFPAATCGDWQVGMTLRQHYAGLAFQGLIANTGITAVAGGVAKSEGITIEQLIARMAVGHTDALIAELEKSNTPAS